MIKMILADDEPVITRGIQKLLDWNSLGIEISGEFEDGKAVFEAIIKQQPDIALLDISMPKMSGVEILKECHKLGLPTKIIFVSGFQDFEYAKEAVSYGAVEYLLKPVIREELVNAVEKCIACLGKKEETDMTMKHQAADDYGKLITLEDTSYTPVYADLLYPKECMEQMKRLMMFSFQSFLEEYLDKKSVGITFNRKNNIVIVLKESSQQENYSVLKKIREEAQKEIGQQTVYIMGRMVENMSEIPASYEECLRYRDAIFFADEMAVPILECGKQLFGTEVSREHFDQTRKELIKAVTEQKREKYQKYFEQFRRLVAKRADGKKEDACFYFCNAIRMVEEELVKLGVPIKSIDMKSLLEDGRKCESFKELSQCYQNILNGYADCIQKQNITSETQTIAIAKKYIAEHYQENLTLNILASEVHMNPYYFSAFFKKNAGENFKDYVGRIRVEHAMMLLVSTDKKTYEIAMEVGFSDARAFADAFQKLYHETPNAYRKRVSGKIQ